jgi:hypothetical protein
MKNVKIKEMLRNMTKGKTMSLLGMEPDPLTRSLVIRPVHSELPRFPEKREPTSGKFCGTAY